MNIKSLFTQGSRRNIFQLLCITKEENIASFLITFGLYFLALIPFCFILLFFMNKSAKLDEMAKSMEQIQVQAERWLENEKEKRAFLVKYRNVDPHYIDHTLLAYRFLQPEIDALSKMVSDPAFQTCESIKERTYFLMERNRLSFTEIKRRQASPLMEEVELEQSMPVEVNMEDVKNLLSMIEGISIGCCNPPSKRPQLVITSFDLKKKSEFGKEGYFLDLHLMKRELLHAKEEK
jgi:hypothetical protein